MASGTDYGNWGLELVYAEEIDVFQIWVGYWSSMAESLENSCGVYYIVAETTRVLGSRSSIAHLGIYLRGEPVSGVVGGATSRVGAYHGNPEANQERIQHQEGGVRMPTEAVSLMVVHLQA